MIDNITILECFLGPVNVDSIENRFQCPVLHPWCRPTGKDNCRYIEYWLTSTLQ